MCSEEATVADIFQSYSLAIVTVATLVFSIIFSYRGLEQNEKLIAQNEKTLEHMRNEKRPILKIKIDSLRIANVLLNQPDEKGNPRYEKRLIMKIFNEGGQPAYLESIAASIDDTFSQSFCSFREDILPPESELTVCISNRFRGDHEGLYRGLETGTIKLKYTHSDMRNTNAGHGTYVVVAEIEDDIPLIEVEECELPYCKW
jgi:hypothetical protein